MNNRSARIRSILLLAVCLGLTFGFLLQPVRAQTPTPTLPFEAITPEPLPGEEGIWSTPVNLSRSGAASQPRIFAAQDGRLQVFWLDRFDGMMTALFNGEVWSLPAQSMRPTSRFIAKQQKITLMPALFSDQYNRIHAFWYGEKSLTTGESPLNYNQIPFGLTSWTPPGTASESALIYEAMPTESGEVLLVYVRTLRTRTTFPRVQNIEPGIYAVESKDNGISWGTATAVENSIYYRVLNPETGYMRMTMAQGAVFLLWLEPRLNQPLYAESTDGGATWSIPTTFTSLDAQVKQPELTVLPTGEVARIWQDAAQGGCAIYQQELKIGAVDTASGGGTPVPAFGPTPAPRVTLGTWGDAHQILNGLETCPSEGHFIENEGVLYWIWGENSTTLSLTAWDAAKSEWLQPQTFSFSFPDPETGRPVQLNNLRAAVAKDRLSIVGADANTGEVWAMNSQVSALKLAFAPPSPWKSVSAISNPSQISSQAAVAVDGSGRIHAVWSQGTSTPGTSIFYAKVDEQGQAQPVELFKAVSGEIVRQPALLVDASERLLMAWSGGVSGEIYFSRSESDQAGSASGWFPPLRVSDGGGSWPQLAQGSDGRVFILYASPVNERRGIYLVFSDDGGETWSKPAQVFDAEAAGYEMVDHPTLAVGADGSLHTAWAVLRFASPLATRGIFYSRTRGVFIPPIQPAVTQAEATAPVLTPEALALNNQSDPQWTRPLEIAPAGSDWPHLAGIGDDVHLIYAAKGIPVHRMAKLAEQNEEGVGWGTPNRIPGWPAPDQDQNLKTGAMLELDQAPFGVAADYQHLRVLASISGIASLRMSEFGAPEGSTDKRWSQPEIFAPAGTWRNYRAAAAASPLSGGKLAVAWAAQPAAADSQSTPIPPQPQIFISSREIASINVPIQQQSPVISAATATPAATETSAPTATPAINVQTKGRNLPVDPLVLGSGLAALIVVAIFIGILVQGQGRGRS